MSTIAVVEVPDALCETIRVIPAGTVSLGVSKYNDYSIRQSDSAGIESITCNLSINDTRLNLFTIVICCPGLKLVSINPVNVYVA